MCPFPMDGTCDVEAGNCPPNSDCVDCDPSVTNCTVFNLDCEGCNSQPGCAYCAKGGGLCYPEEIVADVFELNHKETLCEAEDWARTTCEPVYDDNIFTDPLYDGMKWAYNLVNVEPVWEMGLTGAGVHVRVNDDGVDSMHPEFAGRYDLEMSCEVYESASPADNHGTACASLIAAAGGNDQCAVGMAPNATISACNTLGEGGVNATLEEILVHKVENVDISSNSLGPTPCFVALRRRHLQEEECPIDPDRSFSPCAPTAACAVNGTLDPNCALHISLYCTVPVNFDNDMEVCESALHDYTHCMFPGLPAAREEALAEGITLGRGGLGTIYVFAAGNERGEGSDANYDSNSISRYTIAVGAVGKQGKHGSYSNAGANVLVSAPGGDFEYVNNNLVANPTVAGGGCGNMGPGTSFATPTTSGIIALMLEANSNLGWRDVQAIIATTSTMTDPEDESWAFNGAGLHHSNKYGFGIINAYGAVTAAMEWTNMGPEEKISANSGVVYVPIENNPGITVSSSIVIDGYDNFSVETVYVFVKLLHGSRGDLDIRLTSPSGMESTMTSSGRPETTVLPLEKDWQLMTVRNYNEDPNGKWTLSVTDEYPSENNYCANDPYELIDGDTGEVAVNPFTLDTDGCALLELISFGPDAMCLDGEVVNPEILESRDITTNRTADELCCICGGGRKGEARLVSWKIEVYGHYIEEDFAVEVEKKSATQSETKKVEIVNGAVTPSTNPDLAGADIPLVSSGNAATPFFTWVAVLAAAASSWIMMW